MKLYSTPVEAHDDVPPATPDHQDPTPALHTDPVAFVVSAGGERRLQELLGLLDAHGTEVVGHRSVYLREPNPRTHLGTGLCDEVAALAREAGATLLVVDAHLSPSQTRNLEDATGLSVMDRELTILGVFLKNARSKAARIQVEIAHLQFLRPRIRGLGLDMDQQAGGMMNGKGAGETASELLARQLDDRLVRLKREATRLARGATVRRANRTCERIALVGYTNAGKTSLMNALTGTQLSARARPFETLDTTSRALTRHGGDVLLHDTVGFIRDLPERLLPSFASTLAEATEATLIALVLDASDPEWPLHLETTEAQLDRLGVTAKRIRVFNKVDAADPTTLGAGLHVSAREKASVDRLREALLHAVRPPERVLFVAYDDTERSNAVHANCRILKSEATDTGLWLTVQGGEHVVRD
jgi:GTP-binding protein HflX